jgi:hypothetical protein
MVRCKGMDPSLRWGDGRGDFGMIGLIVGVIVAILLIGLVLKILKIAIILALCVGIVMFAQNKLGRNNDRGRLK